MFYSLPNVGPLRIFYYQPFHVNVREFPPGRFLLKGTETEDPTQADCFVLPTDIRHLNDSQILALPYLKDNEARHVFFSLAEYPKRALPMDAIAFRTDYNKTLTSANPSSAAHPWPVEDLARYVSVPDDEFQFDVHAQLWASSALTHQTVEACLAAGLRVHDQRHKFFYGTLETANDPRLARLRKTFLETMQRSRIVLVPRSRPGINRYRFFEALSMGRVPLLLCDDVVLPQAQHPAWSDCILRMHEQDADLTGTYIKEFLRSHSDADLIERGRVGRTLWEQWLAPAVWEQVWTSNVLDTLTALHREPARVSG